jgi:hypothetical protein
LGLDLHLSAFTWPDGRESNKVEFFPIVAPIIIESAGAYLSEIFLQQLPEVFVEYMKNENNSKSLHPQSLQFIFNDFDSIKLYNELQTFRFLH